MAGVCRGARTLHGRDKSLDPRERVESDSRAAHADAIAEPRRESIVNEDVERLASARNVSELRDKLVNAEHPRMRR